MDKTCQFAVSVEAQDVAEFARLSGDQNPLHVDPAYARTTTFGQPLVPGALLIGLLSRVLGMYIPGRRCVLLSVRANFPKPLFYPSRVQVSGELAHFDERRQVGIVRVTITDATKGWVALDGEASFGLHTSTEDESPNGLAGAEPVRPVVQAVRPPRATSRARLLMTGATGGVGSELVSILGDRYDLACLTRRRLDNGASSPVSYHTVDLDDEQALDAWLAGQPPREYYGIVHLSVPPISRAFVSDDLAAVRRHLRHSVEVPLQLARWARQSGSGVKRVVLLGSTAGSTAPQPHQGAYSLGKAAMEHLVRLLVADLASQGATVNLVVPTVIPVGLNAGLSERSRVTLEGKTPTGRLVSVPDVANVIMFLLSEASAQINGVPIPVDGGLKA